MTVSLHVSPEAANAAAADLLAQWLTAPGVRSVMLAAGNSPLELYRRLADRRLALDHLNIFALDEYVGVPHGEPRNCANVIRRTAVKAWGVPNSQYFALHPAEDEALASVGAHEYRIAETGGLDIIVLGLGQNGHLGFNEPGSAQDCVGRLIDLDPISIEANRNWFNGDHAPARGVTVGMKTILSARRALILAYGAHKRAAVKAMLEGPRTKDCPASFLQGHGNVNVFLDQAAAAGLENKSNSSNQ
ncbi:MAG: 6-phosphogluconolactonase [Verrucomicrobiales bacterium]